MRTKRGCEDLDLHARVQGRDLVDTDGNTTDILIQPTRNSTTDPNGPFHMGTKEGHVIPVPTKPLENRTNRRPCGRQGRFRVSNRGYLNLVKWEWAVERNLTSIHNDTDV